MRLNPPKKITFWVSILIAALGFILFLLTYLELIGLAWIGLIGFLLVVVAFILIILSLILKGL